MPVFDTSGPISVTIEVPAGDIEIIASERDGAEVEVRPGDASRAGDVTAAGQTTVDFTAGKLTVRAPKTWRRYAFTGPGGAIGVRIQLPAGSGIQGEIGAGAFRGTGRLGECRLRTGAGDIRLDQAGPSRLSAGAGDITVDRAAGHLEAVAGSGTLRMGTLDGTATIKNSNGECWVGEAAGELRVQASNGGIHVGAARAGLTAKTANGDIHVGQAEHGQVVAESGFGRLEIGIPDGTAAWLDLHTKFGRVHNELDGCVPPDAGAATVEVRARTAFGDVVINRS